MFSAGPNVVGSSSTLHPLSLGWLVWMRLARAALVASVVTGCARSSQMTRSAGVPAGPYPAAGQPADRMAAASGTAFVSNGPRAGQSNNGAQPMGQAGPSVNGGQAGNPEVVPAPRPDAAGPGPAPNPNCPPGVPGQGPGPATRPAKRASWWRGFLPSDGDREDRPGWWSPDYGGGTSA